MKKKSIRLNQISGVSDFLLNLFFILVSVCCIAPVVLVIAISFTEEKQLLTYGYNIIPKVFSVRAYEYIMAAKETIWRAYGISIFVTIVGSLLAVLIICLYAYPISRQNFEHKNKFSFLAYFTMIFGGGLLPWYMIYTHVVPIKSTVWIMIVPLLMNAYYVVIMRTFIKTTIPEALFESAKIDGAGEFRIFFVIVLPLCKAGLATIGLFCTLNYWNDYYLPLVFVTDEKLYNIQYYLYKLLMSIQFLTNGGVKTSGVDMKDLPSEGARMAIAVISIGPIVAAYPFFQKYFVKGLTIGAVKG